MLVIQTGFIGDNILSTPVFTELSRSFSDYKIDLLTTKLSATLFRADPRFNQVLVYDKRGEDSGLKGFLKLLEIIKKNKYSKIISLHKSIRSSLLCFFSRGFLSSVSKTYGYKEAALSFLYGKTASRGNAKHEVLRILNIVKSLDLEPRNLPLKLYYSEQENQKVEDIISSNLVDGNQQKTGQKKIVQKKIGIAPGSVWATKRWTVNGFKGLVSLLEANGLKVFLIGGPGDIEKCEEISSKKSVILAGKLSLSESSCLISKLDCMITNDSSPLHISSAVNTPVVSIFCATVPEFGYTPWMVDHEIVEVKDLECRPCGRHGGNTCPTGTNFCQKNITSNQVFDACMKLLAKRES